MQIQRHHLSRATEKGIITSAQENKLWDFLVTQSADTPSFRVTHILYYLGGLLAIGAMSLFMNLGWEHFGGLGIFAIALSYGVGGYALTKYFINRHQLLIPAGICAAFVVTLTPLATYGLQAGLGVWPDGMTYRDYHVWVDWRWMMMELATLAVGCVMLWRFRLPFSVMPVAVTLWYMSMDLTPFLFGQTDFQWEMARFVSLWFGLLMILLALWVDLRSKQGKDYAFWLYLFGVSAFWGALSSMDSSSELNKAIYCVINLGFIAVSAILSRRVFAVYGAFGVAGYIGHLAWHVFANSALFPFILSGLGLGVIYAGLVWQRNEQKLAIKLRAMLPEHLRLFLESRQS